MKLVFPENYDPRLSVRETQEAIKYIRDTFQKELGKEMNLERISAPLFVEKSSGLNDNLSGTERPVQFDVSGIPSRLMRDREVTLFPQPDSPTIQTISPGST